MTKKPKDKNIIVRSSNYNPNYLNSGKRDLIFNPGLFDILVESCNDVTEWLRYIFRQRPVKYYRPTN